TPNTIPQPIWQEDLVAELGRLADRHPGLRRGRREVKPSCALNLATLAVPDWAQATASLPARRAPRRPGHVPLTAAYADVIEAMAALFSANADTFGGGHARRALGGYLADDIVPRLREPMHPATRRRVFSAATQLTYLCAFMCFDDRANGLAQRYYRIALQLAAENNDPLAYAIVLRGMSTQAWALGHYRHALHLAEAATATATKRADPLSQAFIHGQLAMAHAARHAPADALASLTIAERHLSKATSAPGPMGAYHFAALAHQQALTLAALGDKNNAIAALIESVRHRPPAERRARAITTARLAELHLGQGRLEECIAAWHHFLDDYPFLYSKRADAALKFLRSRGRPFSRNSHMRALLDRAALVSVADPWRGEHRPPPADPCCHVPL
ncbi:hypothetical protein, partial [Actinomadura sp. KC06]|uniref:hypothetical protein n=1 Tax=Actinomadura sp. KC06 TaxID=2530369 RepID=UPI001A9FBE46